MQYTLNDYLEQLTEDKSTLVTNLVAKGISASDEETFTTLVPKVNEITPVNNQSKSVTITTNTTTNIEPDSGYTGLSSVSVTTNVAPDMSMYFDSFGNGATYDASGQVPLYPIMRALKKLPDNIVLTNSTNANKLFGGFQGTELPLIDTSNVTDMEGMCMACSNIVTLPQFNTSSCTKISTFCSGCVNLENVPILDLSSIANISLMNSMFSLCNKLTNTSVDNILVMCSNITAQMGTTNKKLSWLGFTSSYYPAATIQALPHYQDFIDAGWTIGY